MFKKYSNKEVECKKCHKKVKPLLKLNRVKSGFIGARYTGDTKAYWQICPYCKSILGTE